MKVHKLIRELVLLVCYPLGLGLVIHKAMHEFSDGKDGLCRIRPTKWSMSYALQQMFNYFHYCIKAQFPS